MELKHALAIIAAALAMLGLAIFTLSTNPRPHVGPSAQGGLHDGQGGDDAGQLPAGLRSAGGEDEEDSASKVFDFQNRLDEVRQRYESKQFGFAIGEARALLAHYDLTKSLKAELHFLLSRCFRETGESKNAAHHYAEFRKILDSEVQERRSKQGNDPAQTMRQVVERAEKAALEQNPRLASESEDDWPLNIRCWKKLVKVDEADVISDSLPEGGIIYYCKSGEALQESLVGLLGGLDQVVIHRDPRYHFYFQIVEK